MLSNFFVLTLTVLSVTDVVWLANTMVINTVGIFMTQRANIN